MSYCDVIYSGLNLCSLAPAPGKGPSSSGSGGSSSSSSHKAGLNGGDIFGILLAVLCVVGLTAYLVTYTMRQRAMTDERTKSDAAAYQMMNDPNQA